ncbi:MAG: hypothetical protein EHM40_15735 [Chloroflexi bacterium]|nr:MAG: hypothetical protein EHM40_15735 [Chloroflexota bacterium]
MKKIFSAAIVQYMIRILLFELGLVVVVGVALFLKERSLELFGDWMIWAGLIVLMIGAASLLGGWGITRGDTYQVGMTVGEQDISTRTKTDLKEEESNFSFLQLCAGIGILAIIVSRLV